jgi:hypothetical protein
MHEVKLWHPELPNLSGGNDKLKIGVASVGRLLTIISEDAPSLRLGGLPSHHLKRIAQYSDQTPLWMINHLGISQPDYIGKSNNFDFDILLKENEFLVKEPDEYRQSRHLQMMVQAILRGELPPNRYTDLIPDQWQDQIAQEIAKYDSGQKRFVGLKAKDLFTTT